MLSQIAVLDASTFKLLIKFRRLNFSNLDYLIIRYNLN
jgi:hypothetical protein